MAKILVVDDDPQYVMLVESILRKLKHEVDGAYRGDTALRLLGIRPPDPSASLPDLVILDYQMPDMDGCRVAAAMGEDERAKAIPILVITAFDKARAEFERFERIAGFVQKPVDFKTLGAVVAKALEAA